ncbi:MAG: DUF4384 domain-containing protein [Candidatus Acetothermia bacterium]|jgi:hypothetical protein|nr:DUF4384 domain-containing protein [Candidatus Acetothermia bacterium]MDH7506046.1 DUF4384 domain-containing protein [Candidatus Acetothermia bacterium]
MIAMRRSLILPLLVLLAFARLGPALAAEGPQAVLTSPPTETGLSIKVWLEKRAYEVGERLEVHFIISHDCYVYIYDISSEGKVTLLFPNAFQPDNFLQAGQYTIPDERYSLVVEGKPGLEYLQAIASTRPIAPLTFPSSAYGEAPFPEVAVEAGPQGLKAEIEGLPPEEWAADWTSFYLLEPGRAWLIVTSEPSGAEVYLNGRLAGSTPLALSTEPGYVRLLLKKEGFATWSERLHLARNGIKEINAQLSEAPQLPPQAAGPSLLESVSLPGLGLSLGLDWESLGLAVELLPPLWLGVASRFTAERVPDYYEVPPPEQPWPGERVYNSGSEMEVYLRLDLPLRERLALTVGGGFAVQEKLHLAAPTAGGLLAQDVTIKPNGYRTAENYLTLLVGLIFRAEPFSWELGFHNRRGWLIGLEIEF